jgi:hypothetical protein
MATIAARIFHSGSRPDLLSGTPRAHPLDRWIYVFTAASFIAIVLAGFIPDSIAKINEVEAGVRPSFPLVLHMHALLMGLFLLLLLAQTWLMAIGRSEYHRRLGLVALVLAPALVVVGFMLVPTIYLETWNPLRSASPAAQERLRVVLARKDNILLLQLRVGLLFPLFLAIGLRARASDPGLHKRMMILATAWTLPAAVNRISWLPATFPASPVSPDAYVLLAYLPMFLWDVIRNRSIHRAYWIWLGVSLPFSLVVHGLWNMPWWHAMAPRLLGL